MVDAATGTVNDTHVEFQKVLLILVTECGMMLGSHFQLDNYPAEDYSPISCHGGSALIRARNLRPVLSYNIHSLTREPLRS